MDLCFPGEIAERFTMNNAAQVTIEGGPVAIGFLGPQA
jgi:hypothetical protein